MGEEKDEGRKSSRRGRRVKIIKKRQSGKTRHTQREKREGGEVRAEGDGVCGGGK